MRRPVRQAATGRSAGIASGRSAAGSWLRSGGPRTRPEPRPLNKRERPPSRRRTRQEIEATVSLKSLRWKDVVGLVPAPGAPAEVQRHGAGGGEHCDEVADDDARD